MGKVILCAGKQAEQPYRFKSTGTNVYSIEELCYYIYHNIETVSEELFDTMLVDFMCDELGLKERALQVEKLIKTHAGVKDIIVTIFCSADYYEEEEIKELLKELDYLNNLTPMQRKKRKADSYLAHHQNQEAMKVYKDIIYSKEPVELSSEEYGSILHNIAVIHAGTGAFATAAEGFLEAYERNGNVQSLKQYLYALKIGRQEALFSREMKRYVDNRAVVEQIENELFYIADTQDNFFEIREAERAKQLKEEGRFNDYYRLMDEILCRLKNKYRLENG